MNGKAEAKWSLYKTVSNNGSKIDFNFSEYREVIIVGVKNSEIVSMHLDTSLIYNNNNPYWFGSMVQQLGLVFKITLNSTSLTPIYCFSNSANSNLTGSVIYIYYR